jgi:ribosomal protein S18 acetylase RimI-like enzyme
MNIAYFTPTVAEHGDELNAMARQCFVETFAHMYNERDLSIFLRQAYGPKGLLKDLADPAFSWRAASDAGRVVGYVKVGPLGLPAPDPQDGALELKQLYVLQPWQGAGIAAELMEWAISTARSRGASELYLSVFDDNHRAKRFYGRHGFEEVGRYGFRVGDQVDDDRIWRKIL